MSIFYWIPFPSCVQKSVYSFKGEQNTDIDIVNLVKKILKHILYPVSYILLANRSDLLSLRMFTALVTGLATFIVLMLS